MPEYAVISAGSGNQYGHPNEDTLSRLRDADVKTYRSDMQGDIICISDGKDVTFTVGRNTNAETLAEAEKKAPNTGGEESPTESTYILNANSKKIHYPNCLSVKRMSEKNKQETHSTRDKLIGQGYDPCGNCNP